MSYVVRLKPIDERRGQVAQSYTHAGLGRRWVQGTIHRGVTEQEAEQLRPLRQPGKGMAPLFDVVAETEWESFVAAEAAAKAGLPLSIVRPAAPAPAEPAAPPAGVSIPIETLEHTDAGGVRVQRTQEAPVVPATPPPATTPRAARPKKAGGGS